MNKQILTYLFVFIILLSMGFALGFGTHKYYFGKTEIIRDIDTVYTETNHHFENNLKPIYITQVSDTVIIPDTIYRDMDTLKVIQDFFTKKLVTKHFQDSLVDILVQDTVYMNNVIFSELAYKANFKTIEKTIYIKPKYKDLMIGVDLSFNKISPNIGFMNKRNLFFIGYDFFPDKKYLTLGYKYRFGLWD